VTRHPPAPALGPASQWDRPLPFPTKAERSPDEDATRPHCKGRPRRLLRPRAGPTVRREKSPEGWSIHFIGSEAEGKMADSVMDAIRGTYGPE